MEAAFTEVPARSSRSSQRRRRRGDAHTIGALAPSPRNAGRHLPAELLSSRSRGAR